MKRAVRPFTSCPGAVLAVAALLGAGLLAQAARAAAPEPLSEQNVISGTMQIEFKTRTTPDTSGDLRDGSPALGAQDRYTFSLNAVKTTQFSGSLLRQPNLYTKTLQRLKQGAALIFDVELAVLNPRDLSQKRNVGKWVGVVPIDTASGAYDLAGGAAQDRPLRISVDAVGSARAFTDPFAGRLIGKAEKKEGLASYTYKRAVGAKTVSITAQRVDPMRFENLVLAKGPAETYPRTTVNGRLDYDYETGNWFTDGIRFRYQLDGADYEDLVTGSIKWVEDENRATNGKGYYEFNLRFNEDKNQPAASETAAFDGMAAEDAFFAVDSSVPCLTGRIDYQDTLISGSELPSASKITYALDANKLTRQQIMNFFKLWLICAGPTNDE